MTMKFKLVEKIELVEKNSPVQKTQDIHTKTKPLTLKGLNPKEYLVHHLDSEIISEIDELKSNELDNVLLVKHGFKNSKDDIHRLIHIAAHLGGLDKLNNMIIELDKQSSYIYAIDYEDNKTLIPVKLSDAVAMTIKGPTRPRKVIYNPQGPSDQIDIDGNLHAIKH